MLVFGLLKALRRKEDSPVSQSSLGSDFLFYGFYTRVRNEVHLTYNQVGSG